MIQVELAYPYRTGTESSEVRWDLVTLRYRTDRREEGKQGVSLFSLESQTGSNG